MEENRLKFSKFGEVLVIDIANKICTEMSSLEFLNRSYPMMANWGVRDEDVLIHSLGCSAWNQLGAELGYMPVTECPVPMTHGADIRADSTWFCRAKRTPEVLIEFERFDGTDRGQKKLDEKICNLLEASFRWGNAPSILILSAWSKGIVSAPNKDLFIQRCKQGFKSSVGAQVPGFKGTGVLFSRFIFEIERSGTLALNSARCERFM